MTVDELMQDLVRLGVEGTTEVKVIDLDYACDSFSIRRAEVDYSGTVLLLTELF